MEDRRVGHQDDEHHADAHAHHGQAEGGLANAPAEPGYPKHPVMPGPRHGPHAGAHADHGGHGSLGVADVHTAHGGHDKHAGHSAAMFRNKFWICLALTVPTLIWGHMLPRVLGYTPPNVPGQGWIAPMLGTTVFLYGGLVFLQGAWC